MIYQKRLEQILKEISQSGDHWDCEDSCFAREQLLNAQAAIDALNAEMIGPDDLTKCDTYSCPAQSSGRRCLQHTAEAQNELRVVLRQRFGVEN